MSLSSALGPHFPPRYRSPALNDDMEKTILTWHDLKGAHTFCMSSPVPSLSTIKPETLLLLYCYHPLPPVLSSTPKHHRIHAMVLFSRNFEAIRDMLFSGVLPLDLLPPLLGIEWKMRYYPRCFPSEIMCHPASSLPTPKS
jgi:hypothetical protein